jgi:tetratricopeptide (TPR) repeat protein
MPSEKKCPECGTAIPAGAPPGFCPRCELTGALDSVPAGASPSLGTIRYFGDYELLEEIARGGMGVVYRARQISLNRTVAVKMILAGRLASAAEVQRFRAEAAAAANLQHPSIVAIHEVGEHEGQHYFSMDFVEGQNLAQLVREGPLPASRAAAYVRTIAEAIQFAHEHGILHRDLKPSNVLIDTGDVPRITDFGLAKRVKGDSDLTHSGQVIGTPSFISPEQAAGKRQEVGPSSDVYSLGAILYHLLTGRPPFVAGTLETTLAQVLNADPATPRLLNPSIPRDLETICLKCLEKAPARRYETAKELAGVLGRFLRGEPILARPVRAVEKTWRWCRRNPLVSSLVACVLILHIVIAWLSLYVTYRVNKASGAEKAALVMSVQKQREAEQATANEQQQRRHVEDLLKEVEVQRNRAQTSLVEVARQKEIAEAERAKAVEAELEARKQEAAATNALATASKAQSKAEASAREARDEQAKVEEVMGFLLGELSDKLRPIGRMDLLRAVTERVLAHYESIPIAGETDERRFAAFKNRGQVLAIQGDSARAAEAFQTSLEIAQRLASHDPGNVIWQRELLLCHQRIGEISLARGDSAKALEEYEKSLAMAQRLAAQQPSALPWQQLRLANHVKIGDVHWAQGDKRQALANYKAALEIAQRFAPMDTNNLAWQRDLSATYSKARPLLLQEWGVEKVLDHCRAGLALTQRLATNDPGNTELQSSLALCHDDLGDVLLARKEMKPALGQYQQAMRIRLALATADPRNTEWQRDLLRSYFKIGGVLSSTGEKGRLKVFADATSVLVYLHKKNVELARLLLRGDGRNEVALEAFRYSTNVAQRLVDRDPGNAQWQEDSAQSHSLLGDLLLQAKEENDALAEYRRALEIRQQLVTKDPNAIETQISLALSHGNVAVALWRLSKPEEALVEARTSLRTYSTLMGRWPRNLLFMEEPRGEEKHLRPNAMLSASQKSDLGAALSRKFATAGKLATRNPASEKDSADWGSYCSEMAVFQLLSGNTPEAMAHMERAAEVWQTLGQFVPTNSLYRARLLESRVALGAFQLSNRQPHAATTNALKGLQLDGASVELKAILAMGCFLNGQIDQARTILRQNRNLKTGPQAPFPKAVVDDLNRLRERGVMPPQKEEPEKLLAPDAGGASE